MTPLGFLTLLIIAAIAGSIRQAIVGYSAGGCLVSRGSRPGWSIAGHLGCRAAWTACATGNQHPGAVFSSRLVYSRLRVIRRHHRSDLGRQAAKVLISAVACKTVSHKEAS